MATSTADVRSVVEPSLPTAGSGLEFRPDLQGLRAVAVVLVVGYHAEIAGFAGGFVGVDVFFVVSGFLITLLLDAERAARGRLDVRRFYARRLRRLLPLSIVVIVGTLFAARFTLNPLDFEELRADGLGAVLFGANVHFANQGIDYLAADQLPSALEHYWSLGVEEQIYLVWPLIMVVVRRRLLPVAVAVLGCTSFAASVLLTGPWAFYGPHVRAWQFLLGAGLALSWPAVSRLPTRTRSVLAAGGAAGLGLTLLVVDGAAGWPSWHAALPSVATVALLAGSPSAGVGRGLARRSLVWLGDRSYAFYLVHLPPLVLLPVALDRPLSGLELVAAVTGAVLVADVLHRYVESPLRYRDELVRSDSMSIAFGAALCATGLVTVAALGLTAAGTAGSGVAAAVEIDESASRAARERLDLAASVDVVPANLRPSLADARADRPDIYRDGCHLDFATIEPRPDCVFGDPNGPTTWFLVGDSHAAQWFPALEAIATTRGVRLVVHTKSGCPPIRDAVYNPALERVYTECAAWTERLFGVIETDRPDLVVTAVSSAYPGAIRSGEQQWAGLLRGMLTELSASADSAVLIAETPDMERDVPACLADHLTSASACTIPAARADASAYRELEREVAASASTPVVDMIDALCGDTNCPVIVGSTLVYRDADHLTTVYARQLADRLEEQLARSGAID